jgi:high-affinity iron transporter
MIPTFVIGLREGLEAALIVGIIATFLTQEGRRDGLRWMWLGVGVAVTLCAGVALALHFAEQDLPQKQQEGLETIVGLLAVGMVTWMIVWMKRNARGLKRDLQGKAAAALAAGSLVTLIAMAFLAVLREGIETAVFMLAAFNATKDPTAAGWGAHQDQPRATLQDHGDRDRSDRDRSMRLERQQFVGLHERLQIDRRQARRRGM